MTVMRELRNNGFRMYMARLPPDIRENKVYWRREFLKIWRKHVKGLIWNEGYYQ